MIEDIRAARLAQIQAETRYNTLEGDYVELKVADLRRTQAVEANSGPDANIMTFAGDITDKTVYTAIQTLGIFSRREPECDITILLTSSGGSVLAGFALYDYICGLRERGHKVTIHVMGYAMSMAVTLLQAADERIMGKNSFLLIHEAASDTGMQTYSQAQDAVKHTAKMQDKMFATMAARGNLTVRQIKAKARKTDWLIDAEEALKHGLCDSIA